MPSSVRGPRTAVPNTHDLRDMPAPTTPISARPKAVPKSRKRAHRKTPSVTASTAETPSVADSMDGASTVNGDELESTSAAAAAAAAAELKHDRDVIDEAADELAAGLIAEEVADELASAAMNGIVADELALATAEDEDSDSPLPEGTGARVIVTTDVTTVDDVETTRTSVKIQIPPEALAQDVPSDPDATLAAAKEIVESAVELAQAQEQEEAKSAPKRKADDMLEPESPEEEIVLVVEQPEEPSAKRARVMVPADDFRREKMQKRALVGLSATIAVGAMIPFISSLF